MNKPSIQAAPMAHGFKLKGRGPDRIDLNRCIHDTVPAFCTEWSVPEPEPIALGLDHWRTLFRSFDYEALAAMATHNTVGRVADDYLVAVRARDQLKETLYKIMDRTESSADHAVSDALREIRSLAATALGKVIQ